MKKFRKISKIKNQEDQPHLDDLYYLNFVGPYVHYHQTFLFFPEPYDLSPEGAIILQKLIDLDANDDIQKDDGWIFFPVYCLELYINMRKRTQSRNLKKLKDLGLIDISFAGLPPNRYCKINTERIRSLVEIARKKIKIFRNSRHKNY